MFFNRCFDYDNNMINNNNGCETTVCNPVMECPQERVCHRQMCYEVPHIIPVNTKIINHHVYKHTYQPMYTSTMEDEISNIYDNKCGF